VQSSASYTLSANVENLTLVDAASNTQTFDDMALGPIADGENGWKVGGPARDQAVVNVAGNKVFHISSDPASGDFGGPYSPALSAAAGESAVSAYQGQSIGFDLKAVSSIVDGSRLEIDFANAAGTDRNNFLVIESTGSGLRIAVNEPLPTVNGDWATNNFDAFTGNLTLVSGIDQSVAHHLEMRLTYVDGPDNDRIDIYLDGNLIGSSTTFENFRDFHLGQVHDTAAGANLTDRVLFRTGDAGQPHDGPGGQNQGFNIDNLTTSVDPTSDQTSPLFDAAGAAALAPDIVNLSNVTAVNNIVVNVVDPNHPLFPFNGMALATTFSGTPVADQVTGTGGVDVISGHGGNDTLNGGGGNDAFLYTVGDGIDTIDGGTGTDKLFVSGTAGDDSIVVVVNGSDVITSIEGMSPTAVEQYIVNGGAGTDTLSYAGTTSAVTVNLGASSATGLTSVSGIENVTGGSGNDSLTGDSNANTLTGGAGNDTFKYIVGAGADIIDGGAGTDTLDYTGTASAVTVDLGASSATGLASFTSIENVIGGSDNDSLTGGAGANTLIGGAGDDTLDGGAGIDTAVYSGALLQSALVPNGSGGWTVNGAEGTDTLSNIEIVQHAGGRYLLVGNGGFATVAAAAAAAAPVGDTIVLATPPAPGTPIEVDLTGNNTDLDLNIPTDLPVDVQTGNGDNHVTTGTGDDHVTTGTGDDTIKTGSGNDVVDAGGGDDTIVGGAGNGDDVYNAGDDTDTVVYSSATNSITVDLREMARAGQAVLGADGGGPNPDTIGALLVAANHAPPYGANMAVGYAQGVDIGTDALIGVENVVAGAGNDTIIGNIGINVITGGAGNDTIDGGAGSDTAVFSGTRSQYLINLNPNNSVHVQDLRGGAPDGADDLSNVELLQFSDMTISTAGVVNHAPVVMASDFSATKGQVVNASSLFSASDVDGNSLVYFFYDNTADPTSGHFTVNGVVQAAGVTFALTAAQLAQTTFTAGTFSSDDLFVNVYDGSAFSGPKEFHVNVPANHAPTLMAPDQSATRGQVFNASSLFSASDVDCDTLTYYFYDNSADPSSGHFTVNGVVQAAGTTFALTAAQLAQTTFTAGSLSSDDLFVNVYDGNAFGGPKEFHVNVPADNAPTVMAANQTATSGQVFNASSLFSANDADGDSLLYFFYDNSPAPTSGHFEINGVTQAANTTFAVTAAQLAQTTFIAGTTAGDDLFVNAYDGLAFSGPKEFHIDIV
jgi:Ca2+-binding RTX toxin-like protein